MQVDGTIMKNLAHHTLTSLRGFWGPGVNNLCPEFNCFAHGIKTTFQPKLGTINGQIHSSV